MQSSEPIITAAKLDWLAARAPAFADIRDQYGDPPNWSRPPGFVTLLRIILEQQVSLESAYATYQKLLERLGQITPTATLTLDDAEMRACYVSRQKARYLRILAQAILDNELDLAALASLPEPEVRARLTSLTGIGQWTADVYLLFCLQAPDILPLGDIAVVRSLKELFAVEKEDMLALAEAWRPYRSTVTYCCWHYYIQKRQRQVAHIMDN